MPDLTQVAEILDGKLDVPASALVTIAGWVQQKFDIGGVLFLRIRDGTGILQVTIHKKNVPPEIFQKVEQLTRESSVRITGAVKEDRRAPDGYEPQLRAGGQNLVCQMGIGPDIDDHLRLLDPLDELLFCLCFAAVDFRISKGHHLILCLGP